MARLRNVAVSSRGSCDFAYWAVSLEARRSGGYDAGRVIPIIERPTQSETQELRRLAALWMSYALLPF